MSKQLDISTIGFTPNQLVIAEVARKAVKIDGTKVGFESDLYEKTLPEGVTPDLVKKVQKHNSDFAVATRAVAGESSIGVMAEHKDLKQVTTKIKAFNDTFVHAHNRSKVVRNPSSGEERTVYGNGVSKVIVGGTKNSASQMRSVVTSLGNLASQMLNN